MAYSLSKYPITVWTTALWFIIAVLASSEFVTKKNSRDHYIQSPVNIVTKHVKIQYLPFLRTHGYSNLDNATVEITNTGHTVCITLANYSKIVPYISGGPLFKDIYVFEQIHFHWGEHDDGSEHEINGHKYAMEAHIVHYKKEYGSFNNARNFTDGLCVFAVFGQITVYNNPVLEKFTTDLRLIKEPKSSIFRDFREEFFRLKNIALNQHYFTYHGSLTTFPFTECVIWIVFTEKIGISRHQLNKFRQLHSDDVDGKLINENGRPLQPFNNGTIMYRF